MGNPKGKLYCHLSIEVCKFSNFFIFLCSCPNVSLLSGHSIASKAMRPLDVVILELRLGKDPSVVKGTMSLTQGLAKRTSSMTPLIIMLMSCLVSGRFVPCSLNLVLTFQSCMHRLRFIIVSDGECARVKYIRSSGGSFIPAQLLARVDCHPLRC